MRNRFTWGMKEAFGRKIEAEKRAQKILQGFADRLYVGILFFAS